MRWLEKGTYKEAMDAHEASSWHSTDTLQKWKNALHQVANLSGTSFAHRGGYLHEFIEQIVEKVSRHIKPFTLYVGDNLVGLEPQMEVVIKLLDVTSDDRFLMVGIHGIGGIGKTTLSLAVYNSIADQFEGSCFVSNIRENSSKHGLTHLQKIVLSEVVGEKNIELTSVQQGIQTLQQRLCHKKVLLLLDDVDNIEQLKAIAGNEDWFGDGSRVIITTRDIGLLTSLRVKKTYEMNGLNKKHALDLLICKAFGQNNIASSSCDENILHLLECAVDIVSGLPLALEVIGSHLFKIGKEEWKCELDLYERIPDKRIQKVLEVSFNALDEEEKNAFLDIACCFKGFESAMVEKILQFHLGVNAKRHIRVLIEKSLIKISAFGHVTLHDLIEDMGKEIIRRESPQEPQNRSRLWNPEDIVEVLQQNTGTSKIEIICLNSPVEVNWDGEAFKRTTKLRTLIITGGCRVFGSFRHLPNSLRILMLQQYPSPYLPFDFYPKIPAIGKLVNVMQRYLFMKTNKFVNVRFLNLDDNFYLRKVPNISSLPNLEELSFQNCRNLITVDNSVGLLGKLKILRFYGCVKLRTFSTLKLASLEELDISFCESLEIFPRGLLNKLKILNASYCKKLKIFPPLKLASLEELNVSYCESLESFPLLADGLLNKVKILNASHCKKLKIFPPLMLASLEELDLSYCERLECFLLVVDGFLDKLKILRARGCRKLKTFPLLNLASLEKLDLFCCESLESFPPVMDRLLDKLQLLNVSHCKELKIFPPLKLASLKELDLSFCESLESFPPVVDGLLDKLGILNASFCKKLKIFPALKLTSLKELDLSYCESLECYTLVVDGFLDKLKILNASHCKKLKIFPPLKLASVENLNLSYCGSLECFPLVVDGFLGKLQTLNARGCQKLKNFPLLNLAPLRLLDLCCCESLESFPLVVDGLLNKLQLLNVSHCKELKIFPPLKFASLKELDLSFCESLESFPPFVDGLLNKLKILNVSHCEKLKIFPPLNLASLEELDISYCESLESFPPLVDGLLNKVKILNVSHCKKLKIFPPLKLASLEELNVSYCESLESFPPLVDGLLNKVKILNVSHCKKLEIFPPVPLENLDISWCETPGSFLSTEVESLGKLKALNINNCSMLHHFSNFMLSSGEYLKLSSCSSHERNTRELCLNCTSKIELPFGNFTGLKSLCIHECGIVHFQSSIVKLSNLDRLEIGGGEWLFPEQEEGEENVNPSTAVKSLCLLRCNLSNESLATGLKWFANVKELNLSRSKFTILPECIENCQHLRWLILNGCEELLKINGIPASLKYLFAGKCKSLTFSSKKKLLNQELHEAGNTMFCLPAANIPQWFDHKYIRAKSFSFWFRNKFPNIVICYVLPRYTICNYGPIRLIINGTSTTFYIGGEDRFKLLRYFQYDFFYDDENLLLFHLQSEKIIDNLGEELLKSNWIHVEIDVGFSFLPKSGIHVLKEKSSMEDIRFTKPENDDNNALSCLCL